MLTRYSLQVKGLATMDTTVKWPIPGLTLVAYQAVLLESVNNESATCAFRGSDAFSSKASERP